MAWGPCDLIHQENVTTDPEESSWARGLWEATDLLRVVLWLQSGQGRSASLRRRPRTLHSQSSLVAQWPKNPLASAEAGFSPLIQGGHVPRRSPG